MIVGRRKSSIVVARGHKPAIRINRPLRNPLVLVPPLASDTVLPSLPVTMKFQDRDSSGRSARTPRNLI